MLAKHVGRVKRPSASSASTNDFMIELKLLEFRLSGLVTRHTREYSSNSRRGALDTRQGCLRHDEYFSSREAC